MRTFEQLTIEQRVKAVNKCLSELLESIVQGSLGFNDELNHDDLQARIDRACAKADQMQTPWFAHEYILDTCSEELGAMARSQAEDALYAEPSEHVIAGIATMDEHAAQIAGDGWEDDSERDRRTR